MPHTDDHAGHDSNRLFTKQEHDIVQSLNTYLKTIDTINPGLLADRPCIDLSLNTDGNK